MLFALRFSQFLTTNGADVDGTEPFQLPFVKGSGGNIYPDSGNTHIVGPLFPGNSSCTDDNMQEASIPTMVKAASHSVHASACMAFSSSR